MAEKKIQALHPTLMQINQDALQAALGRTPLVFTPPVTSPQVTPTPSPTPTAPSENLFDQLPYPSPGDRIQADDFKKLSQSLRTIYDAFLLSGSLFGAAFGEAKLVITSRQFVIARVMSVYGTEIDVAEDSSLDDRKVIQVAPLELGQREVAVVLTETGDSRKIAPNLMNMTFKDASQQLQATLGNVAFAGGPITTSQLVGSSLAEAKQLVQG